MVITADQIVVRDEEPLAAEVDREVVVLSTRAQAYFGLGEIGSEIWGMIALPRRVSDICAALIEDYDVDRQTCQRDTVNFLAKLLEDGLIRVVDQEPPAA